MRKSMIGICSLMLLIAGCADGRDPHGRQAIHGVVTFRGQPLDQGSIRFQSPDPNGLSAGALIQNGKYQIPREQGLPAGTYTVHLSSLEPTPPLTGAPGENPAPPAKERLPEEYNVKTRLKAEIKPDQTPKFDFEVK
jgi:hypothetical protein